jgi:ABC-type iron transport system FetAB ATPase subunit
MLEVRNLVLRSLEPLSFDLAEGECMAVRGPSGAGKSLLLRAIADLDRARGEILLGGVARESMEGPQWRRRVRYLAAESGWWLERAGEHFRHEAKAREMARRLGLDAALFDAPIARLSSGERQRLAFIRALEDEPELLLLDEPTAALDDEAARKVEDEILRLKERGRMIIIVTHSEAQAERLADRTLTIENGRWELTRI